MKSKNVLLVVMTVIASFSAMAQSYNWNVTSNGMTRDGVSFFMKGQSWAKQTAITYNLGMSCESDVKAKLTELNAIGVNTLRVYGSPDDSDFAGTSNFANLIKWIEEWNAVNPDGGDPNKAMYYMVQINPEDNISPITDDLPENTSASFNRAIHDTSHPGSVASLLQTIDGITGGSDYLIGYQIYHELNGSTKYKDWYDVIGASGIESFMNSVADAIHNDYAPGKLVTHTGDAKQPTTDIYEQIENLDGSDGNVLENFDLIGFNLYISTKEMLNEGSFYDRIPQRRGFSVNNNRGWYIGETGASSDVGASTGIPAVNYTQSQALANLQIMWDKSKNLGNMIGFVLFTVQDNDLGAVVSDNIKQRGYYDHYGDKKFLYYAYPDVVNEISTNNRYHNTNEHAIGVSINDNSSSYTVTFDLENKTSSNKTFFWSIYGDDGSTNQRFNILEEENYETLTAGESRTITKTVPKPSSNDLFAVELTVIDDLSPANSYSYGRDEILSDAIGTVAGLNLNLTNLPDYDSTETWTQIISDDFESGYGNWNDGGTDCMLYTGSTFSYGGTRAIDLQDNTSTSVMTTDNLNLSSYSEVRVAFAYIPSSMESGEDFWLQISTDGGITYNTKSTWAQGIEFTNNEFYTESVIIDDVVLTNETRIRFRCDASGNGDDIYIDDVIISARGNATSPSIPVPPNNLIAVGFSSDQINLTWNDNADDENGFKLERSENGTSDWTEIAALEANATSYSDTDLIASKTYYYRVLSSNTVGDSSFSNIDSATTKSNTTLVTVTIGTSDDAYVRGGDSADINYGSDTDLLIKQGSNSNFFRKTYLKFDVSAENLTTVSSAVVRIYANSASIYTVTAYQASDSWNENSITWNNAPSEGAIVDAISVNSSGQYYEFDVTSYLQNELSSDGIITIILNDASSNNQQIIFNSKEASTNNPELIVTGISSQSSSSKSSLTSAKVEAVINANVLLRYEPSDNSIYISNVDGEYSDFILFDLTGRIIKQGQFNQSFIELDKVEFDKIFILKLFGINQKSITKKIFINN